MGIKATSSYNLAVSNLILAQEWHKIKNGSLTSHDVTPMSGKKVWWSCKKDKSHEWQSKISDRSRGNGCPYCANLVINESNCLATLFPQLVNEWHPTKNGSLTPYDVPPGSDKKVWWLCKKDKTHEWNVVIYSRTAGNGCPFCANLDVNESNCLQSLNPVLAKEWHPLKNVSLTPNDVTPYSHKKVWWVCKRDNTHEWVSPVGERTSGSGCPFCHSSSSEPELRIYSELKYVFKEASHRKKLDGIECDIYLPEIGVAVEIDGSYWHRNKLLIDNRKTSMFRKSGIHLIRVRDTGLPKISESDIVHTLRSTNFGLIKAILQAIIKTVPLTDKTIDRINGYISTGSFQNEEEYKKLQNMLPGPLPGAGLLDYIPELAKEWHPTKNGTLSPADVSHGSKKKVWWVCEKNALHEWEASVGNRIKGNGCPYCSGRFTSSENCLSNLSPNLANEWHPVKNGHLTPKNVSKSSDIKVWWICKKNHEWVASVSSRNRGNGCPYCSGRFASPDNCLLILSPALSEEWHTSKNDSLTPSDVTPGSNKQVWWVCRKYKSHEWKASVINRSKGRGCPHCAGKTVNSENCLATHFPQLALEWHPSKNSFLTPNDVTRSSGKKVWWICTNDKSHEWEAVVSNRTKGKGCPFCWSAKRKTKRRIHAPE